MKTIVTIIALSTATLCHASDREAVAAVLCAEAGISGRAGMEAVFEVVLTRAAEKKTTALAVVTKRKAFSCLNGRTIDGLLAEFRGTPVFRTALNIVNSPPTNRTGGSNHYHHVSVRPRWAIGATRVAEIGAHVFLKL